MVKPKPLVTRPTVSVIVPCYNYGHYLADAVASVLSQPGVEVDVLIVDDCSTDGSEKVAESLASDDSRIQVLRHETNKGHIATYNDGLKRAQGDYVVLLSADDLLAPGSLERSTALMQSRPDVGLVYGYAPSFSTTPPPARMQTRSWSVWTGEDWIRRICVRGTNIIVNPEAVIRRPLMDSLVGYDARYPHAADMHLWMRAAARANVGRVNGPDQAFYREHGSNMHLTDFSGVLNDMRERRKVFEQFFTHDGVDLPRYEAAHATSMKSIARESVRLACLAADNGGSHDGETAEGFAEFAQDCLPSISSSRIWGRYKVRTRRSVCTPRKWMAQRSYAIRWIIRWRRWRRFGS